MFQSTVHTYAANSLVRIVLSHRSSNIRPFFIAWGSIECLSRIGKGVSTLSIGVIEAGWIEMLVSLMLQRTTLDVLCGAIVGLLFKRILVVCRWVERL